MALCREKVWGTGPLPRRSSCSWDVFVWRQNLGLGPTVLEDNFGFITLKFILCIFQVVKCHFPAYDTWKLTADLKPYFGTWAPSSTDPVQLFNLLSSPSAHWSVVIHRKLYPFYFCGSTGRSPSHLSSVFPLHTPLLSILQHFSALGPCRKLSLTHLTWPYHWILALTSLTLHSPGWDPKGKVKLWFSYFLYHLACFIDV